MTMGVLPFVATLPVRGVEEIEEARNAGEISREDEQRAQQAVLDRMTGQPQAPGPQEE